MGKMKKYYNLESEDRTATVTIYGDITSYPWEEMGEVSALNLSQQLQDLDVDLINVHINSYGGEVAEGWAIYNVLKQHKAEVHTFCDGFACSIASVVFMAGDQRTMGAPSGLYIHPVWSNAQGNADDLRAAADELEQMTEQTMAVYRQYVNINDEELADMVRKSTWIFAEDAVNMGFATDIASDIDGANPEQNAKRSLFNLLQSKSNAAQISRSEEKKTLTNEDIKKAVAEAIAEANRQGQFDKIEPAEENIKPLAKSANLKSAFLKILQPQV